MPTIWRDALWSGRNRHFPNSKTRSVRYAFCAQFLSQRRVEFAMDSPLEGDGFELPVPREKARYPIGAQLILLWLQPRV